jgi:hypothetical protein
MTRAASIRGSITTVLIALLAGTAGAHITPPVALVSDRDAVTGLLAGARKFFVREVRLSPSERQSLGARSGWTADEEFYRFYLGRDDQGRLLGSAIFMTEYTIHGPVRVAVGIAPGGTLSGATVVELTEETYPWLKPLIDQQFTREYLARGAHGDFSLSDRIAKAGADSMPRFYAQVVLDLVRRALNLYDVTMLPRETAPNR